MTVATLLGLGLAAAVGAGNVATNQRLVGWMGAIGAVLLAATSAVLIVGGVCLITGGTP